MDLSQMISALEKEKSKLFRSTSQGDRGRFYVVNQIMLALEEFGRGYDKYKIDSLLGTIGKIYVDQSTRFIDKVESDIDPNGHGLFKIPVFPISIHKDGVENDLIYFIFNKLHSCRNEWLLSFSKQAIDNFELVRKWENALFENAKDDSAASEFTPDTVYVSDHEIDDKHLNEMQAHIQSYISRSNIEHEAKLPAFQFICRSGGIDMSSLLMDIFESEFSGIASWDNDYQKRVDWTYDDNKKPICNTTLGVELKKENTEESILDLSKVHHDPRIFCTHIEVEKEPDLLISSTTRLLWENKMITPDVRSIILSGRHSNLMPLMYRFA